ncbi:uncharacterized protein I206_106808 [Kwoniella pini CBS 10737]|uniref:NmrA-like domain-containing protein n=1 Tax=Kwoniella pini CBS 10737 TaxID=1296096 RepID=A0AAJ8MT12_9TREE
MEKQFHWRKGVPTTSTFLGTIFKYAMKYYESMLDWFASDGYRADIEECKKVHPGMISMEDWLKEDKAYSKK